MRFVEGDIRDPAALSEAIVGGIEVVIHFAALKAVGESCERPIEYFDNNILGAVSLLRAMEACGVSRLVFSSSASVYGEPDVVPVSEDSPLRATNPYAQTKIAVEQLVKAWCNARPNTSAVMLRYFNPIGAHPSGRIGEDARGAPSNLMPYMTQVAAGLRDRLRVFGADYPTPDGTGVRDYLHVMDLADAHAKAVNYAAAHLGCEVFNLGTGRGYSVLELVSAFERSSGVRIPLEVVGRRKGDIAALTADATKANEKLKWVAVLGVERMCEDAWRWQSTNPNGYSHCESETTAS